eukprot:g23322.t2
MTTEGTEALYNADQLKSLLLAINPEMEKPELGMPFADYRRLYLEGRMRRARLGRVDGPMVRHRWTNLRRVKVALWVAVSQAAAWRAFVGQPLRVGRPLPSPAGHSCTVLRGLRGWLRLRKGRKARKEAIPVIIHESQAQREERNRNRNFWTKAVHWVPRLFPFSQENGDTEPLVTVDLKDLSSDEVNFILQEEAEDGLDSNLTAAEPRREGFMRESQFWRWTGALGWSLNFILLCWALFLRKAGLIDEGQDRFFGGDEAVDLQSLKYDTSTYADLVASQLQEERYVSESNRDISTVLEGQKTGRGLGSSLEALRQRAEEILRPTEEKLPNYDEVVISQKISEMQADLEEIRFDRRSPAQSVLQKLSQKPGMLRDLAEKISPILPERPNQGLLPEEFPRFLEQSAVPVMAFLTASFLVAVLSQQFLTVVTPIWRRNEEERKAMRVRKIQKDRFQEFTTSLQDSLEDLAQGRLAKAAKGFDALAAYADRWASEPTWEELLKAEIGAFWEQWGPQGAFAAILVDGQVVTWGKYGCGGESWQVQEQLKRGRVRQVSASAEAFAAILEDETVVTWGNDTGGGDSSGVQDQLRSVQEICGSEEAFAARLADGILLPGGVKHLAASQRAFAAILEDGGVVTWGNPEYGGDSSAVREELINVRGICSTEDAFAALLADGGVVTWGEEEDGGDSSEVQDQLHEVQELCGTWGTFAALLAEGSVVTWGFPLYGGDSSEVSERLKEVKQLAASQQAFAAVRADGQVITWGTPAFGATSNVADEGLGLGAVDVVLAASERAFAAVTPSRGATCLVAWGDAFRLEANIEDWTGVPRSGASEQAAWVADRWFSSAKAVIRDFAMDAVKSWGEEASKAAAAARAAQRREATAAAEAARGARGESGLVIRIFGRWKAPEDWVNIANLPLAGDWREQALRLLLPSAKDVQDDRESRGTDVPLLGPLSEQALTAVVSGQVARAVKNSTWGALTTLGAAEGAGAEGDRTDLWRGSSISSQKPFEIGYEVVEVVTKNKEEMCALARNMPKSGTPGRVFRVNPDLQSLIESLEAAEPTEPTAVRRFPAGSRVTIKGLTGAAELNGQKGEVVPPTPQEAELAAEPRCHTRASCFTMAAALADLGRVALDVLLAVGPWVSSEHVAKSQHVVQMRHSRLESFQEGVRDMLDEHLDSSQNLTLKSTLLFGFCTAILVEGFPPQKMESEMCVDVFLFLVPWGICWLFQSMTFAVLYQRGMMTVGLDLGAVRGFNGSTIGVGGSQGRHEAPLCSALVATASLAVAATNRVAARGARGAARGSARCALRASPMQKTLNSLGAGMSEERRLAQGMREEMVQATIEASTPVPISFEQAVTWACSAALRANEEGQNRQSMYFNTGAEDSQVTGAEDTKAPSELGGVLQFAEQVAKTFALSNKLPEGTGVRVLFTDFGAKSLVATRWNPLPENLTLGRRILDHLPPVLPKRELRMEERTKLSEMCESSVMLVVAPNQSEMAAVLGIFDVMKDLGKSLGQRGPEVAVVVRVWPRPFSVWEDNPEDPEAIDGYFLLDVNDTRAQDSWMMVVQVSEKEGHHHLRDLQRIATKQAEEEILQGSQTFVDVLENRLSRSQLRRQDGRGGTTDALCAADSRRLSELLLQSLQFRRRTGGGRRSATARTTSPERAAAAEVESEVATLPSGLVHVKEWAKMEEVTALENYVDQAQRTVEAGGLFTLAALGSLARSTRRISAQPREEHQMALAARCGIFLPPLMVGAFVSSIRPFPDKLRYRESALDPEEKLLREGQNNRKIDHWPLFFYPTGVTGVQEDSLLLTTDFAPKCPNFLLSGAVAPPPRRAVSADEERFPQRVRGFTRLDSNAVVKFPCGFAVAVHHGRGTLAALWPLGRPKRLPAKMEHQGKLVPVQAPPELGEEFFQRPNFSVADGVHVRYGLEGDLRWIVNVRQGALNGLCLRFEPEGFEIVLPMKKALQLALSPCEQRLCYEHHVDVDAVRPKELNQYPPGQGAETLEEVDVAAGGRSPREWWRPQVKIVDPSKVYEAGPLALGLGDF